MESIKQISYLYIYITFNYPTTILRSGISPLIFNHIGCLFRDHVRGNIGVARRYHRHYRSIDHSQPLHTDYLQNFLCSIILYLNYKDCSTLFLQKKKKKKYDKTYLQRRIHHGSFVTLRPHFARAAIMVNGER